jgi:tRNA G18 (ribose-2'-O)-methylase SpoU
MNTIVVHTLDDPRLADYAGVRERQLAEAFSERPLPGSHGGSAEAPLGKFMAEGEVVFQRLVRSEFAVQSVLCTPGRLRAIGAELALLPEGTPIYVIEADRLEQLVGFNLHRGLMAIGLRRPARSVADVLTLAGGRMVVVMEDLANHDNVGSLFRNAAAFGAGGVLLSPGCADPLYRKATRVAVGYTLTMPFARVEPWPTGLAAVRAMGYRVLALTPKSPSRPLREVASAMQGGDRVALLVGAEGPGLTDAALAAADERVRIPMAAGVDSLNVSVAAAVALENLVGGR